MINTIIVKRLHVHSRGVSGSCKTFQRFPEGSVILQRAFRVIPELTEDASRLLPGDKLKLLKFEDIEVSKGDGTNYPCLLIQEFEKL